MQAQIFDLRLLATTDLHMQLLGHDYLRGNDNACGLEHLAGLICRLRSRALNTMLFDNGDLLQGNPLADDLARRVDSGRSRFGKLDPSRRGAGTAEIHPAIAALNLLRYDAATLGNHDFGYGKEFLVRTLARAAYPVVLTNARLLDLDVVRPWVVLRRRLVSRDGVERTLGIGVVGFVPPQTTAWEAVAVPALRTEDVIAAATRAVPQMRAAGADVVIALCHGGVAALPHRHGAENAAAALAMLDGINAVIAGHTHEVIPGPGLTLYDPLRVGVGVEVEVGKDGRAAAVDSTAMRGAAPLVMPGFGGSHLGVIDLVLRAAPIGSGGEWQRVGWTARTLGPDADPDGGQTACNRGNRCDEALALRQTIRCAVLPAHKAAQRASRHRVGRTDVPLSSHFALIGQDGGLRLVAMAQRWHLRGILADGPLQDLPVLAAVAPFRAGGRGGPLHYTDIAAGRLTRADLVDLYTFTNRAAAVVLTGAELVDWLERAAGAFRQIVPHEADQRLTDPAFPSYNFDVIAGLDWRFDVGVPARYSVDGQPRGGTASRIMDLRHAGKPVDPDQRFVLATNDYRLSGVGLYAGLIGQRTVVRGDRMAVRDVVHAYLRRRGRVVRALDPLFGFAPVVGASAVLHTGPGALAHLSDAPLPLAPLGTDAEGFACLRLSLDPTAAPAGAPGLHPAPSRPI